METFVYADLNSASRDHDKTKIFTLGPLSRALDTIVQDAERNRPEDSESLAEWQFTDLYRGLTLPASVIKQYQDKTGKMFFMGGFTSTSIHLQEAINYALKNNDEQNLPVLMHIKWKGSSRWNAFRLDKKEYSAMP